MEPVQIFNFTANGFVEKIQTILGKGAVHALEYYKHLFKKGSGLLGHNPQEAQAFMLFQKIHELVAIPSWEVKKSLISSDVEKYVLSFSDKHVAELVVIPMKTGLTLCVSSQVGCKMACAFCETGRMGKLRDLSSEEIVAQVFFAKHVLNKKIKNIVFMGMGEPFDNFEALTNALKILTDPKGMGFPPSKITVSTSGLVPRILDFIPYGQMGFKLAVSINGSTDQQRTQVMPVNRKYNMAVLHAALTEFTHKTNDSIFAEYVLMQGVNDSLESAEHLSNYLCSIKCIINLIPYNAQSHDRFAPPSDEQVTAFKRHLMEKGFQVFVRQNKGDKIMAACGQLGQLDLKKSLLQKDLQFLRCP